jgi:hypothetical protein
LFALLFHFHIYIISLKSPRHATPRVRVSPPAVNLLLLLLLLLLPINITYRHAMSQHLLLLERLDSRLPSCCCSCRCDGGAKVVDKLYNLDVNL